MVIPESLKPGARIRVIAPSSGFDRERFERGIERIRACDWEPVFDERLFVRHRYLAGDDTHRLELLFESLHDETASALWCVRGGYGATRIIERLGPALRESAPRWLVGFSDITALHSALARFDRVSMHGANITTLDDWEETHREELFGMLRGEISHQCFEGCVLHGRGTRRGILRGGNLAVLTALAGTGALPSFEGAIVVLEDVGERPYRLDRALTQLIRADVFAGAEGFAIGQLSGCEVGDGADYTALDVVAERLGELGLPVLAGLPVGHDPDSRAVCLGARAELDLERAQLNVAIGA